MDDIAEVRVSITSLRVIITAALFLIIFDNAAFFSHVTEFYPISLKNIEFLISLVLGIVGLITAFLLLFCFRYTTKPIIIFILMVSSLTSYFMNNYNVVIDVSMIRNVLNTNTDEVFDLLNMKLVLYLLLLGVLPSLVVYKMHIHFQSPGREIISRIVLLAAIPLCILPLVSISGDYYSSFFREHKSLRFYSNPGYYLYSIGRYVKQHLTSRNHVLTPLGLDAKISSSGLQRKLVIFVVGEAARFDRFSLNGYQRETNPLLKKDGVISFTNFWSCGTSTAVSVPCMFSVYGHNRFTAKKALSTENVLDVLRHAGVNVLWLDNNSSSKGVADRVTYINYRSPHVNRVCDGECRDEGMLPGLQDYINRHSNGDIFIVLHQMGNHGPDYYKRYPARFRKFTPVCSSNLFEECSKNEINNAYDNAILYTDYFLDRVIALLKQNREHFETAMFYVSDHGESLGEYGVYLHGFPYFFAPQAQVHIPAIMWLGDNFNNANAAALAERRNKRYSHDNVFHTILGMMGIHTSIYKSNLDIIHETSPGGTPNRNSRQIAVASAKHTRAPGKPEPGMKNEL